MEDTSAVPVDLEMTAGLPYKRRVRVSGAALIWPTQDSYEVRGQLRVGKLPTSQLIANLGQYLNAFIELGDIVVDIGLTGSQTRTLSTGYYDLVLSDPGAIDARAIRILFGKVKIKTLMTGVSGD